MEATYSVRFGELGAAPGDHKMRVALQVVRDSEILVGRGYDLASDACNEVLAELGLTWLDDGWDEQVADLLVHTALHRITGALGSPAGTEALLADGGSSAEVVDDAQELLAFLGPKSCRWQLTQQGDLYCAAASRQDPTAVGTHGLRRLAPTSRPICAGCGVPDERLLCSHLSHPQVEGIHVMGDSRSRHFGGAMCDLGQSQIEDPARCHVRGHDCWEHVVEPERRDVPAILSPLALADELDFLDAAWRLAYGAQHRLIDLGTTASPAGLAVDCRTREEFQARMSDLADILARLRVADELAPKAPPGQALNRMEEALAGRLDEAGQERANDGLATLRRINNVRRAMQHSGAARELPKAFLDLGLSGIPENWGSAWNHVRAAAAEAVKTIRVELLRVAR